MDLLLIKIGKVWNVLKRDGLWRGGRRVALALASLFRRVTPGDILFLSNGVGDSARYRTTNVAEELRGQGFTVSTTVQDNPFLVSYARQFSVFVFHRVFYTEKVAELIAAIKEQGKTIIFETDDLVYDPAFLPLMDAYQKMNTLEKKLYEHGLGGEILADPYVEVATTTTTFLADKLREKGKRVFVVRNKLSEEDIAMGKEVLQQIHTKDDDAVRLCYLSGTMSHNKDFATITPVLVRLLAKYSRLRLVLAGPLDIDSAFVPYASQIERVPFMARKEYFAKVAEMDINLAPLERGNPFCESKSELKWFEAGLVGVPTIATATRTFMEAITDGVDGMVAHTDEEWQEKLVWLIENKNERVHMGEQVRQTVLARYTTKTIDNTAYYQYLKSKISGTL